MSHLLTWTRVYGLSLCGIKTCVGIVGVDGDAELYEFLDDIKCSHIEVGQN